MANTKKKNLLPVILLIVEVVLIAAMAVAVFTLGSVGGASATEVVGKTIAHWVSSVTFGGTGMAQLLIGLVFWVHVLITVVLAIVYVCKKSGKSFIGLLAFVLGYGLVTVGLSFTKLYLLGNLRNYSKTTLIGIGVGLIATVVIYILSWACIVVIGAQKVANKIDDKVENTEPSLTEEKVREIVRDEIAKANLATKEEASKVEEAPEAEETEDEDGDFLTADDIRGIIAAEVDRAVEEKLANYQPIAAAPAESEAPAAEETDAEPTVVDGASGEETEEGEEGQEASGRVIIKKTFANKIKFLSDEQKALYSKIKNELLAYKCTNRAAKMNETFRKSGIVCRIVVSGKSIRVNLPLDPNDLEKYPENRYHQKDYGSKKSYADTPFGMNVKSDRACTKAIELIQQILEEKGAKKSPRYQDQDFTEELMPDGSAILEVTAQADKLVEDGQVTEEMASKVSDDVLNYIPTVDMPEPENQEVSNVNVQIAAGYTTDIKKETLRSTNSWYSSVNDKLYIKSNGEPLDKAVRVECDAIDPLAAKMILMRGGKVVKINRVAKDAE